MGEKRMRIQNRCSPWRKSASLRETKGQFLDGQGSQNRNKGNMANSEAQDLWGLKGGKAREGSIRMRNLEGKKKKKELRDWQEVPWPALPVLQVGFTSREHYVELRCWPAHSVWYGWCCIFGWQEGGLHSGEMRKDKAKEIKKEGSSKLSRIFFFFLN